MFKRKSIAELPVNLRQGNDKRMAYSYIRSHSRNMRRVNVPSLSLLSLVGYTWTAVGLFGFFYGLFALLKSKETVELVCPLGAVNCVYSPPPWVMDGGRYKFLQRNKDGNNFSFRRIAMGVATIVMIDDQDFVDITAGHLKQGSTGKYSHTVGISFTQPKGKKKQLYMNFDGMNKRQARERAKRFTKKLKSARNSNVDLRIKETYYTRSLPVVYIVLGMFTCIARLLAWDLRGNSNSSMNRAPAYRPVQKKSGL